MAYQINDFSKMEEALRYLKETVSAIEGVIDRAKNDEHCNVLSSKEYSVIITRFSSIRNRCDDWRVSAEKLASSPAINQNN